MTTRGREWARSLRNLVGGFGFYRGFVESVKIDATAFVDLAPRLYRLAPVLQLDLSGVAPVAGRLFGSPHLRQIRTLSLLRNELGDAEVELLAASPHLGELRWLDLGLNRIGAAGLEALAASPNLPRLEWLGFRVNAVGRSHPAARRRVRRRLRGGQGAAGQVRPAGLAERAPARRSGRRTGTATRPLGAPWQRRQQLRWTVSALIVAPHS